MKDLQELDIKVKFLVEHSPATPDHLFQILKSYFESRGIKLHDDFTIEV
jgi:hypothetical protein